MADNVWMSELTILEMRDLVGSYGYRTALILNGTMEANGPYLTTGKHNHVLAVTGETIARTLGNTLIASTASPSSWMRLFPSEEGLLSSGLT